MANAPTEPANMPWAVHHTRAHGASKSGGVELDWFTRNFALSGS